MTTVRTAILALAALCIQCGGAAPSSEDGGDPPALPLLASGLAVLELAPDPEVVTNVALRDAIRAVGLPWRIEHEATGIELLLVPTGGFTRGAAEGDSEASDDERPAHAVVVAEAFYLGRYEVTQAEWHAITGDRPSTYDHGALRGPVEQIDALAAQRFASLAGLQLPTESEWEFACRAGGAAPRYGLLSDVGWFGGRGGNGKQRAHPVGQLAANALGFSDMLGNVWEWTASGFLEGDYGLVDPPVDARGRARGTPRAILRGGSWYDPRKRARASARYAAERDLSAAHVGLRVSLSAGRAVR